MYPVTWILVASGVALAGGQSPAARPPRPAAQAVASAAPAAPARAEAYYQFLLGLHLEGEGDVAGAVRAFERAATADPRGGEIRAALANLYARQNLAGQAITAAEDALRVDPDNIEAHAVLGGVFAARAQQGLDTGGTFDGADAGRAIGHLEKVTAAPDRRFDVGPSLMLGRLYVRTGAYDKAVALLGTLVEREPGITEATWLLAQAYESQGRRTEAIAALEQALADEPRFYRALLMLAELYERERRWDEAAGAYARAAEQNPRATELRLRQAQAWLTAGDAAQARELLEEVVTANPTDASALYLLSDAQRRGKDFDAASATARRLVALEPRGLRGPYALALVDEERHDPAGVVKTLAPFADRAASSAADVAHLGPLLVRLGFAYQELGQFDEALATFERAETVVGDSITMKPLLAQAYLAAGQYEKGLAIVRASRAADPRDPRLPRVEAQALQQGGDVQGAIEVLGGVREQFADDLDLQLAYASALAEGGRLDEALAAFDALDTRFDRDVDVAFRRGAALERRERYADAEAAFREALRRDPRHAETLNYLGYMLADRGDRLEEATSLIERALAEDAGNPSYLDSLGWAWFKRGNLAEAKRRIARAAELLPRNSVVQDHLGDVLYASGDRQAAVEAWRRALAGDGQDLDRAAVERKVERAGGARK
jgi:tetratricopeptide (TPR) repeat protein